MGWIGWRMGVVSRRLASVALAWLPFALIVLIGVTVSVYASFRSAQYADAHARADFERQAESEIGTLKVRINASLGAVTALAALYEARGDVARAEFQRFAETMLAADPSIQALEWAQVVSGAQRAQVERRLSAEYGFDVRFTERVDGKLVEAGERSRYAPVTYVTPMQGNQAAVAFDLASEATRRSAITESERTGQPVASGRIQSVQQASEYSFLLFRPVFVVAGPPRQMTGLVLGLFRVNDLVAAGSAGRQGARRNRLLLLDLSAPIPEQILYASDARGQQDARLTAQGVTSDVMVGGRVWRIVVLPPDTAGQPGWIWRYGVLAVGLLLTGNLGIYVLLGMRRWGVAERERKRLDQLLRQSRERLALATESARIGIWDWDLATNKLVWDARMYELYGIREEDFSGAYDAWLAGLHLEDRARGDAAIGEAINGVSEFNIEFRVVWPNGEIHHIEAHALVRAGADGCATRMIGVNWDITERRRAMETIGVQADRYATMLSTTSDGFFILDRDGRFFAVNDAYCTMTGYSRDELLALTIEDVEAIEPAMTAKTHMQTIVNSGFDRFESQHRRKDEITIDIEGSVSFQRETGQFLCFARDITKQKQDEAALQASERKYRDLFDSTRDAIMVFDPCRKSLLSANASALQMFGVTDEQELLSRHPWDYSPNRQPDGRLSVEGAHENFDTALREGTHLFEWVHMRADGTEFPTDVLLTKVTRGDETLVYSTVRDITERKRADQRIARMAHYDNLTGLVNRLVFVRTLERRICRARQDGSCFAVLYLDLDHFKDINDTLGHPVGDELLKTVAERLRANVRPDDTVARFGGDEFAILLNDMAMATKAGPVSDRLIQAVGLPSNLQTDTAAVAACISESMVSALAEPIMIEANRIYSGATIGIAVYGPDSPGAETLLAHADMALYRAKAEQRGTYRFFTEGMDAEVKARVSTSAELREAIRANQFFLMYQPQVDISANRIVGLEALIRWRHPTFGIVGPHRFIAEAEWNGLIVPLGRWVIREACHQARLWLDAGLEVPSIAVNLSGVQFKRPLELERDIVANLAEFAVPPHLLELELTESVLMEASRAHNNLLLHLREAGHRIAVDDFGTGYSSLDYLRCHPVDRIKIAQTFVRDLGIEPGNDAIVRAALGLARELNIEVVVEGVETLAQLELLKGWGGRIIQGYYFAKPLHVAEVAPLLRTGSIMPAHIAAAELAADQSAQSGALRQRQFPIPVLCHLVAPRAIGRRASAVARDDAGLLAFDVAVDAGHPRVHFVG
jgi:diguanylate cyclase (GGDEF)-like protein/PAS domain S-box-containing protein